MTARFIVKIMVAAGGAPEAAQQMTLYDRSKAVFYSGDVMPDIPALMGPALKKFMYAHLDSAGKLVLEDEAPEQEW